MPEMTANNGSRFPIVLSLTANIREPMKLLNLDSQLIYALLFLAKDLWIVKRCPLVVCTSLRKS